MKRSAGGSRDETRRVMNRGIWWAKREIVKVRIIKNDSLKRLGNVVGTKLSG